MLQSTVTALCICIWTIALIGLGAEPTPWLAVRRGAAWHELTWRGRGKRVRYVCAWRGDSRYRSIEWLSV
jgi:hypothetical protein